MNVYSIKRTILGQLPTGADLYESLTQIIQRENITLGRLSGIGATTHAVIAYFDQIEKKYSTLEFPDGMEIVSLNGNISIRDGKPFIHAHIVLSDAQGKAFGGHLLPGTKVLACEVTIDELEGDELVREFNEKTGLALWKEGKLV
ncbi:MAG: DNA-binding protein [Bacteroidetes bacterium]|nr:MAG: DNA-binding protein [Bacteroidota bacterium]